MSVSHRVSMAAQAAHYERRGGRLEDARLDGHRRMHVLRSSGPWSCGSWSAAAMHQRQRCGRRRLLVAMALRVVTRMIRLLCR